MTGQNHATIQNLWFILKASLFGDFNIMGTCSANNQLTATLDPTSTSSFTPQNLNKDDGGVLSINEFFQVYIPNSLASIHLWLRVNMKSMAELQCRRVLRIYESIPEQFYACMEDVYLIFYQHIRIILDIICPIDEAIFNFDIISNISNDKYKKPDKSHLFSEVIKIINSIYPKFQSDPLMIDKLNILKLFVRIRERMYCKDIKTALRLSKQYESYFDTDGNDNSNNDDDNYIRLVSQEQFESKLIHALCFSQINPLEGYQHLLILISYRNTIKFRFLALKAYVYYACLFIRSPSSNDKTKIKDLIYEMHDIQNISKKEVYPELEELIIKHFFSFPMIS